MRPERCRREQAEHDRPGHRELREVRAGERDQLLRRRRAARAELDERTRRLALLLVGAGEYRGQRHLRMTRQRRLDRDSGDVLAAGYDDGLRAVLAVDVAVGVLDREVAGMEPAAPANAASVAALSLR